MDLRQLRYFVGIIHAGSLSRAADQLRVAQSALSHHLASLESELDKPLVTRGPKGIVLTEAGTVLYRHAEVILRQVESAKQAAKNAINLPSGRVSIGFPSVLAPLLSYELFKRVRTAYPQILLYVSDANSAMLRERLINGRLDIAVLYADQRERGLAVEPLALEELFYVTAEPDTAPILMGDAAQRPLLTPGPGSTSRRIAEEAFKEHGLAVTSIGEINALSALQGAIASGIGNAILSWAAIYSSDQSKALNCRRFADAKLVRPVALCFPEMGQRPAAVEAVAETLKSLVCDQIEGGTWQGVSLIAAPEEAASESRSGFRSPASGAQYWRGASATEAPTGRETGEVQGHRRATTAPLARRSLPAVQRARNSG
jgi:LysR family transcriptional regulator, nitrogen assimilation regulatory protein